MKLSKKLAKAHNEALTLVRAGRPLKEFEQEFVLENFQEGATHMNGLAGAFFTPMGLARDFSIEVVNNGGGRRRILDLCAGIGGLSWACDYGDRDDFVCVERNPDYVEVGRAIMPRATWVTGSIFDVAAYQHLGPFDVVISNPPFGAIKSPGFEGKYTGALFEYRTIELASRLARRGVFIIPQESANFRYSGQPVFRVHEGDKARKFREQTGLIMEPNCGIDCAYHRNQWHGVAPAVEIVCVDFSVEPAVESPAAQADLFAAGGAR